MKKFIGKMKNNRGDMNGIIAVCIALIILIIAGFALDFTRISWQKYCISNELTFVGRVAGKQGGIESSKPADWDTNFVYNSSSSVYNAVKRSLDSVDIDDFQVSVGGKILPGGSSAYTYKDSIKISITASVKNGFLPIMMGKPETVKVTLKDEVLSERWVRNNSVIN